MIIQDEFLAPFFIKVEPDVYILQHNYNVKGKETAHSIGYYTSLPSLIKKVIALKLSDEETTVTLNEYISKFQNLMSELNARLPV